MNDVAYYKDVMCMDSLTTLHNITQMWYHNIFVPPEYANKTTIYNDLIMWYLQEP